MTAWAAFTHCSEFSFDVESVCKNWERLHAGDALELPQDPRVLMAWALFHGGHFQRAAETGFLAGGEGLAVANKATCIYANYMERNERTRMDLFQQVADRAAGQLRANPGDAQAHYARAYALGRYSRGISVAKAMSQGLGTQVRESLEKAIALQPRHADAHLALATFHAEVIDKLGALIGAMTYGANRDMAAKLFAEALRLNPGSPLAAMEYANGLVMLEGDEQTAQATRLYEQAAACSPIDAAERLDVELARAELED